MLTIQQKIAHIYSMEQLAQAYRTEAELTRSYGNHALAFFGLAPENLHFMTPDGSPAVALSYGQRAGTGGVQFHCLYQRCIE